jgi:hypothetical protein
VSRFENGEEDIQLSSAMKILGTLGMVDKRQLVFPKPRGRLDFDRDVIEFWGEDGHKKVRCTISVEALEGHFCGSNAKKIYMENRDKIEKIACQKYLGGFLELDGSVMIRLGDF